MAQQKPSTPAGFEPARHDKDDWLDKIPGKHRLVFDSTTSDGFGDALAFSNNYFRANKTDYGLESSDLAVVIVVRHRSTPFGYNDAMWAKYGLPLATRAKVDDPKTKLAPKANMYNIASYGEMLTNRGFTIDSLAALGVQFAVCSVSTRGYAAVIADTIGGNVDAIFNELSTNLMKNARMVPAGIVAVNRAQERGYTFVSA